MSKAIMCDMCKTVLGPLTDGGDDEFGERAGWLNLEIAGLTLDLCTRSCLVEAVADDSIWSAALVATQESIAEIARVIREDANGD